MLRIFTDYQNNYFQNMGCRVSALDTWRLIDTACCRLRRDGSQRNVILNEVKNPHGRINPKIPRVSRTADHSRKPPQLTFPQVTPIDIPAGFWRESSVFAFDFDVFSRFRLSVFAFSASTAFYRSCFRQCFCCCFFGFRISDFGFCFFRVNRVLSLLPVGIRLFPSQSDESH